MNAGLTDHFANQHLRFGIGKVGNVGQDRAGQGHRRIHLLLIGKYHGRDGIKTSAMDAALHILL